MKSILRAVKYILSGLLGTLIIVEIWWTANEVAKPEDRLPYLTLPLSVFFFSIILAIHAARKIK